MKRLLTFFAALMIGTSLWGQQIFTVVFATSDDGFVNVRERPSSKAPILAKLWIASHGLGNGVLRGLSGNWSKVSVGDVTGYAYSKYVGSMDWYLGNGSNKIIATRDDTPIYVESHEDASTYLLFAKVPRGTVIADQFEENNEYYILTTAHDNLFIKKGDAKVVDGLVW